MNGYCEGQATHAINSSCGGSCMSSSSGSVKVSGEGKGCGLQKKTVEKWHYYSALTMYIPTALPRLHNSCYCCSCIVCTRLIKVGA